MSIFLKPHYGKSQLRAIDILRDPLLFLAFGFGAGLSRLMPGTIGTLAAMPVYWLLYQTGFVWYSLLTVLVMMTGVRICGYAAEKLQCHDFGGIVWDEIAGLLITLWWVPFSWQNLILGFLLFRLFDIFKPWPIKWVDRKVAGGFGIMLDDVLAGLLAALTLFFLNSIL